MRRSDTFSTYLMFLPLGPKWEGRYIAIAQINWSWTMSANNPPGGPAWPANNTPLGQPTPTTQPNPTGGMEFPGWQNTTPNFNAKTNPYLPGY